MCVDQWLSQSCVYSWSLRGAWGVHDDHTQLTACTRTKSGREGGRGGLLVD